MIRLARAIRKDNADRAALRVTPSPNDFCAIMKKALRAGMVTPGERLISEGYSVAAFYRISPSKAREMQGDIDFRRASSKFQKACRMQFRRLQPGPTRFPRMS